MLTHTIEFEYDDYEPVVSGLRVENTERRIWFAPFFAKHHTMTIGRTRQRHIQASDLTVSRLHCEIVKKRGGRYTIVDRKSKNGVHVARFGAYTRRRRIKRKRLEVGMHIYIGDITLVVVDQNGQCPILSTRYSEFLRFAAAIYGTAACAAEYIGRSPQVIRRMVKKAR